MSEIGRSFLGVALLIGIGWALSMARGKVSWRTVLSALAVQMGIGAIVLFSEPGKYALTKVALGVTQVLEYGYKGTEFLFGGLVGPKMFEVFGGGGFVFAFRVLPSISFVTSLIAVL